MEYINKNCANIHVVFASASGFLNMAQMSKMAGARAAALGAIHRKMRDLQVVSASLETYTSTQVAEVADGWTVELSA